MSLEEEMEMEEPQVERRALLKRLGVAAAAGAAASVVAAKPASAGTDGDVVLGHDNVSAYTTTVRTTGIAALHGIATARSGVGLWGSAHHTGGAAVRADAYGGPGVYAFSDESGVVATGLIGVVGTGHEGPGIKGITPTNHPAIWGDNNAFSDGGAGVLGTSWSFQGVAGVSAGDVGVVGRSDAPATANAPYGVLAVANGIGVRAEGALAPLYLVPRGEAGPPTSSPVARRRGEVMVDRDGVVYHCREDGNPGKWFRIGYNALPMPVRLIDTRDNDTPLGPGERRPFLATKGVPPNVVIPGVPMCQAVLLNVTAVPPATGTADSYLALLPSDAPTIESDAPISNVNWRAGQLQANQATVRVGPDGFIHVFNRHGRVHVILDAIGFYT